MPANPPSPAAENPGLPILPGSSTTVLTPALPFWLQILTDAGGNPSSMRVAMLGSFLVVLAAWATISVQAHALQPLPESVVFLLSVLTGGKYAQKFIEPQAQAASPLNIATTAAAASGGSPGPIQAPAPATPESPEAAAQP